MRMLLVVALLAGVAGASGLFPDGNDFMVDTAVVLSPSAAYERTPRAAFDGTNWLVVWEGGVGIGGCRLRPDGTVLDSTGLVLSNLVSTGNSAPDIAFDGTNCFVVWSVWVSDRWEVHGVLVRQDGSVLAPVRVTGGRGWQRFPAVAFDGTNYLVAWHDREADGADDIYAARVTPQGTMLDPDGFVVCAAADTQRSVAVSRCGDQCLVAWQDRRGGSTWFDVYAARVSRDGTVLDPDGIAVSGAARYQTDVAVSAAGGDWLVTWQDDRNWSDFGIYAARVNAAGTVLDPGGIVISDATRDQVQPAVGFDGANWLVAWVDSREGMADKDVFAARVSPSGTVLDPNGIVVSQASFFQEAAGLAFGGANWLAVWQDNRNLRYDTYAARITPSGSVIDTAGILMTWSANSQTEPDCASDGTDYLAVWEETRGVWPGVYAATLTESGRTQDVFVVADDSCERENPAVAFANSNYLVVWNDERDNNNDLYAARVTPAGVVLDPGGFPVCALEDAAENPDVAGSGTNWLAVWEDDRVGSDDIYAARVTPDGTVLDPGSIRITFDTQNMMEEAAAGYNGTDWLVAWEDGRNGGPREVYAARLTGSGVLLDTGGILLCRDSTGGYLPDVASDGTNWLVVWEDTRGHAIYGTRVAPDGAVLDPDGIRLWSTPANQWSPKVVFDGTDYVVVWSQNRTEPPVYAIMGARVSTDGVVLDTFPVSLMERFQDYHSLAAGQPGSYFVAWELGTAEYQGRDYNSDRVWAQFGLVPGVAEDKGEGVRTRAEPMLPTVVRGVLHLRESRVGSRESRCELLDISGRRVLDLAPGANDVRGLTPGVYFVRRARARTVRRIVITR